MPYHSSSNPAIHKPTSKDYAILSTGLYLDETLLSFLARHSRTPETFAQESEVISAPIERVSDNIYSETLCALIDNKILPFEMLFYFKKAHRERLDSILEGLRGLAKDCKKNDKEKSEETKFLERHNCKNDIDFFRVFFAGVTRERPSHIIERLMYIKPLDNLKSPGVRDAVDNAQSTTPLTFEAGICLSDISRQGLESRYRDKINSDAQRRHRAGHATNIPQNIPTQQTYPYPAPPHGGFFQTQYNHPNSTYPNAHYPAQPSYYRHTK